MVDTSVFPFLLVAAVGGDESLDLEEWLRMDFALSGESPPAIEMVAHCRNSAIGRLFKKFTLHIAGVVLGGAVLGPVPSGARPEDHVIVGWVDFPVRNYVFLKTHKVMALGLECRGDVRFCTEVDADSEIPKICYSPCFRNHRASPPPASDVRPLSLGHRLGIDAIRQMIPRYLLRCIRDLAGSEFCGHCERVMTRRVIHFGQE